MSFEKAVEHVLEMEGGYVDHPSDPGGETNFGISKRAYPNEDIKNMTKERAIEIYKKDYWDAVPCNDLDPRLAFAVFDCAVNQGVVRSRKLLQAAISVGVDGIVGPVTIGAANRNPEASVANFMAERALHYSRLNTFSTFGKGWMRRLFKVMLALKN